MGRRKNKRDIQRSINSSVFIIIFVIFQLSSVAYVTFHPSDSTDKTSGQHTSTAFEEIKKDDRDNNLSAFFGTDTVNIALLGFDHSEYKLLRQELYRPDTIMIASFNFNTERVSLVNIPRDSYVRIHGRASYDKINHAYMYGYFKAADEEDPDRSGLRTTLLTIQDFLGGVPVHEYVVMDIDGAVNIINSIGGIYYDVDAEVRGGDSGRGEVIIAEGYQHLDGNKFMTYIRNRAEHQGGERGRVERQQRIIIALFEQLKTEGSFIDINALYRAVSNNVKTELNLIQILALSLFSKQVKPEEINSYVFSGRGQIFNRNGQNIYYLIIDEKERVEIIQEVFGLDLQTTEKK